MDMNDALATLEDVAGVRAKLAAGIPDHLMSDISAVVGVDAFEQFRSAATPQMLKVLDELVTVVEAELKAGAAVTRGELNDRMHVASLAVLSEQISAYVSNGGFAGEADPTVHVFAGAKPKFTVLEDDEGILAASQGPAVNAHPPVKLGMRMFLKTAMVVAA